MPTPATRPVDILLIIAQLHNQISMHLEEISYCYREMLICITDSTFDETDRQALKLQIKSLKADVARWREEIRHYQAQYAQSSRERPVPSAVHRDWDTAQ